MTVISGKDGYINGVPCLSNWQASAAAALQEYAASCTGGGVGVTDGNKDWTGSASGIGYQPALLPDGVDYAFLGVVDNDGGGKLDLNGTILVSQMQLDIPIAAGGPITWSTQWAARGAMIGGTVGAADATFAEAPSAKLATIGMSPTFVGSYTEIPEVQSISLTLTRTLQTYVSAGFIDRVAGNLSSTISFEVLDRDIFNALYDLNIFNVVELTVAPGKTWNLPMKWGGKSNLNVDVSTRSPVGYTVNGQWSAVVPIAMDANSEGWIKMPDDTYFFGSAPAP